ncbi:cloroquine resistance associated protein cg1, putative [Plasmodium malariae]|uniref:Cloroquine resistance associated protein cg1, putative n=1 Tax=Plasmodium malariae TaxID=5858 RepID=A0A1A8VLC9_PLAMA|nr:cloroquine resistance associated protein cg1, putative [Plasmodium malariae]
MLIFLLIALNILACICFLNTKYQIQLDYSIPSELFNLDKSLKYTNVTIGKDSLLCILNNSNDNYDDNLECNEEYDLFKNIEDANGINNFVEEKLSRNYLLTYADNSITYNLSLGDEDISPVREVGASPKASINSGGSSGSGCGHAIEKRKTQARGSKGNPVEHTKRGRSYPHGEVKGVPKCNFKRVYDYIFYKHKFNVYHKYRKYDKMNDQISLKNHIIKGKMLTINNMCIDAYSSKENMLKICLNKSVSFVTTKYFSKDKKHVSVSNYLDGRDLLFANNTVVQYYTDGKYFFEVLYICGNNNVRVNSFEKLDRVYHPLIFEIYEHVNTNLIKLYNILRKKWKDSGISFFKTFSLYSYGEKYYKALKDKLNENLNFLFPNAENLYRITISAYMFCNYTDRINPPNHYLLKNLMNKCYNFSKNDEYTYEICLPYSVIKYRKDDYGKVKFPIISLGSSYVSLNEGKAFYEKTYDIFPVLKMNYKLKKDRENYFKMKKSTISQSNALYTTSHVFSTYTFSSPLSFPNSEENSFNQTEYSSTSFRNVSPSDTSSLFPLPSILRPSSSAQPTTSNPLSPHLPSPHHSSSHPSSSHPSSSHPSSSHPSSSHPSSSHPSSSHPSSSHPSSSHSSSSHPSSSHSLSSPSTLSSHPTNSSLPAFTSLPSPSSHPAASSYSHPSFSSFYFSHYAPLYGPYFSFSLNRIPYMSTYVIDKPMEILKYGNENFYKALAFDLKGGKCKDSLEEVYDYITTIYFDCSLHYKNEMHTKIINVFQSTECHYYIHVTSPLLCAHPTLHTSMKAKIEVIKCFKNVYAASSQLQGGSTSCNRTNSHNDSCASSGNTRSGNSREPCGNKCKQCSECTSKPSSGGAGEKSTPGVHTHNNKHMNRDTLKSDNYISNEDKLYLQEFYSLKYKIFQNTKMVSFEAVPKGKKIEFGKMYDFGLGNYIRKRVYKSSPMFHIGNIVKHRYWNYQAVVVSWDYICFAPNEWKENFFSEYPSEFQNTVHYLLLINKKKKKEGTLYEPNYYSNKKKKRNYTDKHSIKSGSSTSSGSRIDKEKEQDFFFMVNDDDIVNNENFHFAYVPESSLDYGDKMIYSEYLPQFFEKYNDFFHFYIPKKNHIIWKLFPYDFFNLIF